ncbi:DUF4166 domain-containing protein [Microbacterium sp. NPDC076768]|uniref:DUF4166 domain-containing protein n=1 Tax=Microbacterium sp. NPDC076768 TaxID=3154858 RepID=UPI00341B0FAB
MTSVARGAVFLAALGDDAVRLHPEIRAQMQVVADSDTAEGVFEIAGSRFGRLAWCAAPVVGPGLLVTRRERNVPFSITTVAAQTRSGRVSLDTAREFRFRAVTQHITDRLTITARPGIVHNVMGARGRVQLLEHCSVTAEGALRMRTHAVSLKLGRVRIALRGILRVDVDLVDGWDEELRRRTINMRATNPLLGTVLEYRGWYRHAQVEPGQ